MEIRAKYVLVGLFTLLVLLGAMGVTLWLGGRDKGVHLTEYDISVKESIKGLSINSDVLFIGIRVGKVKGFNLSSVTPGEVRVRIAIDASAPVREDSVAQLEYSGITGGAVISISGGTADSPLKVVPEGHVDEILYQPSPLSTAVMQMPEIMSGIHQTLQRLEGVLSEENIRAIANILKDINNETTAFAERGNAVDAILLETEKVLKSLNTLMGNANEVVDSDMKNAAKGINRIVARFDQTLKVMEPGLGQFSSQGLSELRVLMVEMRGLVQTLTRISKKMESDPRRFFLDESVKEFGK